MDSDDTAFIIPDDFNDLKPLQENALAYVAGFIVKLKLKLTNCSSCRYNILNRTEQITNFQQFIYEKEYNGAICKKLLYINSELFKVFVKMYNIVKFILSNYPQEVSLLKRVISTLKNSVDFTFKSCPHSSQCIEKILEYFPKLFMYNYFNGINNIINGKDRRPVENKSNLHLQAYTIFKKYKK